jgi:hypothetical protein
MYLPLGTGMKHLVKSRQLTAQDWRLFVNAFVTLAICRTRLRLQNFQRLLVWAASEGRGRVPVNRLTWSVEAAAKRMKGATCLCKALALQRILARNGHHSELRIGVDKADGQFTAHAWLVYKGQILAGGGEIRNHKTLAAWSSARSRAQADGKETKQ